MAENNPLKRYFRRPAMYMRLPTQGKWYTHQDVELTQDREIAVYGLTALDEIMLNTPDAMLNGKALEEVICHCAPDIKNIKGLLLPDIEALFVAIKIATDDGKHSFDRNCPKCSHENNFELNCQYIMDSMTFVEDNDTIVNFNEELVVSVKPYSLEMRQLFLQREFEEQRTLRAIDENNKNIDEFEKARIISDGVGRLSKMTFDLVSRSIVKIILIKEKVEVTDPEHINEWLLGINKNQSDAVIKAVNALNEIGIKKTIPATCTECGHEWSETVSFDPVSFFARR
jgi:DNA-directed RNA polymerase subunit M/transcription elongation factor TFIIS